MANRWPLLTLAELRANPIFQHRFVDSANDVPKTENNTPGLDTRIHPLWRYTAWRNVQYRRVIDKRLVDDPSTNISVELWNKLQTTLQLATAMLYKTIPYMVILSHCPVLSTPDGKFYFDVNWRPGPDHFNMVQIELVRCAQDYRILRMPHEFHEKRGQATLGRTGDTVVKDPTEDKSQPLEVRIYSSVASEFFDVLEHESWQRRSDTAKASFYLQLATTLVHELSHAVFRLRRYREMGCTMHLSNVRMVPPQEPLVWPDFISEIGWSWARFLFGFEPQPPWAVFRTTRDITEGREPYLQPLLSGTFGTMGQFAVGAARNTLSSRPMASASLLQCFKSDTWQQAAITWYFLNTRDIQDTFEIY